ncbi:MAG: TIM barrel protein [Planctomycetota bacterium]
MTGRQSELIELTLTYAFQGMDIDMFDMQKRAHRSGIEEAAKYIRAVGDCQWTGFNAIVDLVAAEEVFVNQVAQLHPTADLARGWEIQAAYVRVPSATDTAAFPECFDQTRNRIAQIADVLSPRGLKLGLEFVPGVDAIEGRAHEFIRTSEQVVALLDAVKNDDVGILLDTYQWVLGGGTVESALQLPVERIVGVRVGQLAGGVAPNEAKSTDRVIAEPEGPFDHVKLLKGLLDAGFTGGIAPTASIEQYTGSTREQIVTDAQEALDKMLIEAGLEIPPRPIELIAELPVEPIAPV